jgi:hypothetical protein
MRRLALASAILATLLIGPIAGAGAAIPNPDAAPAHAGLAHAALAHAAPALDATSTDAERATAALDYLLAAQQLDGSLDGSLGETADFVFGTAAAGYDPATLRGCAGGAGVGGAGALDFLASASDAAAGDAAKTGKAIVAVVAAGADPADFAGRDLVARLSALYHSETGAYGDGATFSQSFAVLALAAAGQPVPAAAIGHLEALQDADGSWSYGSAPVPAGQGDTNSTAIALMALAAAGDHSADAAGLAFVRSQQLPDGGFPYQNASIWGPPASDPDSDAIVLQALVATGQDPEAAGWSQGSNNVLTHLRSIQDPSGGFAYPGFGPDAFTTSQVPAALVRVPYAGAVRPTAGRSLPGAACPSPSSSPTSSPSPIPSLTVKPTARPTVRPTARPTSVPTPTSTANDQATARITAQPSSTGSSSPTGEVASATAAASTGATSHGSSGSSAPLPAPAAYVLAALVALAAVLVAGWAALAWRRSR